MTAFDPAVELTVSGLCPVQVEGKIGDRQFYFRARHKTWTFDVAIAPGIDPCAADPDQLAFSTNGPYGHSHEAGYMPTWDVLSILGSCVRSYVTEQRLKIAKANQGATA